MRIASVVAASATIVALASPAPAQVTGLGQMGFSVQEVVQINAPPARVWEQLLKPGPWWNAEHTYSHDSNNMTIEPRAGGCWCERWAAGSVEHMHVVLAMPQTKLRMRGGLGPLQEMGLEGAMTWTLTTTVGGGTQITLDYAVGGYSPRGFAGLAPAVDGVLMEQLNRLQMYMQTGSPVATATQ